jgi:hypothetical protein
VDKKLELVVIVNGQPAHVAANPHAPLRVVVEHALQQTENIGQPAEQWEVRDAAGVLLEQDRKAEEYHFAPGTRLFLNLKAGVGG